ncbi:MAG TPA: type II toxin-antitoxin system YhaV family toxin [Candidatus Dormibacteraeota bacterium]|nr:type II toxin-antitoxin system YhaV family toxin [Candidatus Dormibacteraeota bacterium]
MVINGWRLFAHPLFTQQLERLTAQVEALAAKDVATYKEQPATKLLATIRRYILEIIPRAPNAAEFRQGNTLGQDNRNWFRAKFHERYRLFYRFSSQDKVIIYAWVNDEDSLRKAGAKTDPYAIFQNMLASGNPPSNMGQLLSASKEIPQTETGKGSSSQEHKTKKQARQKT